MPSSYFKSYNDYFWQWEDETNAIAIPNGKTIVIRDHISEVLEQLSFQGLPPFGSLLLVISALNPNGKDLIKEISNEIDSSTVLDSSDTAQDAFNFLMLLTNFPNQYKTGNKKKILLKTLFQNCHNITSAKRAELITNSYSKGHYPQYDSSIYTLRNSHFQNDFKVIGLLLRKFKNKDELLKKLSNLPEIDEEFLIEQEDGLDSEDFIETITQNYKTRKIGSLVKMIWSGLNLPFHSSNISEQATGGVSDLTNKGNLDQLLISEFANDDLIFLTRLANNEALYLSREAPPSKNDTKRILLVDISLKNWGTPKTIAFAIMLAIAKHPKTDIECEVFLVGNTIIPIEITSVDDIVEAIQHTAYSLNCSEGLLDYFNRFPLSKNREVFILTERSTLLQPAMANLLNEHRELINYLILNDSKGVIDVYKNLKKSRKHIQTIELPFKKLWQQKRTHKEKHSNSTEKKKAFPILVNSTQNSIGFRITDNGEIFQLTKEKTLLRFFDNHALPHVRGWESFYQNIAKPIKDFEIGLLKNGEYVLLMFDQQSKEISLVNTTSGVVKNTLFDHWKQSESGSFTFHQNSFYYGNYMGVWAIDLEGTVTNKNDFDQSILTTHKEKIQQITKAHLSSKSVFKNIKTVGINQNHNLLFNVHELQLSKDFHIKLGQSEIENMVIEAQKLDESTFEFDDGSRIEINKSGIILLKSSNPKIPVLYVPSVLNRSIGIATRKAFTGQNYYFNEPLYEITIQSVGRRLESIRTVKEITLIGLTDAAELLENVPCVLPKYITKVNLLIAEKRLEKIGIIFSTKQINEGIEESLILGPNEFFEKYINPFINTIQRNVS